MRWQGCRARIRQTSAAWIGRLEWKSVSALIFEIEFSNGGGIQGQEFRLDIEGDDISDDALADYIVHDMRLLMVGTVRILNKRIIEEPHKRPLDALDGAE